MYKFFTSCFTLLINSFELLIFNLDKGISKSTNPFPFYSLKYAILSAASYSVSK